MRKPFTVGLGLLGLGALALSGTASSKPSDTSEAVLKGRGVTNGSGLVLADFRGVPVAIVADEDENQVRVFELSPPKEIASAKVPGTPSQLLVLKNGTVLVALKDKGKVAILEPKGGDARSLVQRGSIDTGGEPMALATTPDEATLLVASGWTHSLAAYAMADKTRKMEVDIGREPRAIAMASDGSRAFVTHASTGAFTTVDLANQKTTVVGTTATLSTSLALDPNALDSSVAPSAAAARARVGTQGFAIATHAGKLFVPAAFADPGAPETYYGSGMEAMGVLVVDEVSTQIATSSAKLAPLNAYGSPEKCLLPRAAAVTSDGKKLVVGCAGESELMVLDATAASPRTKVLMTRGAGDAPSSIAIDDASQKVIAWSQMGRMLSVVSIADKPVPRESVTVGAGTMEASIARGRRLFVSTDGRMAADGRACASCHTDGRDDGLVWHTPEGNRQTPMLAARLADTAPYGWTRDAKTFHAYVTETVSRLRGKGFSKSELDDLSAYVMSLKAPPKETLDEEKAKLVKRGAEVFASTETGCASCHSGAAKTDGSKHLVDAADKTTFATPSLRFVGGTAPYFHDGRYKTLRDLLTSNDPNMGRGKDLPEADLGALEAYLKSL